jgi:hypothetical protein
LDKTNFGLLDPRWAATTGNDALVQGQSFYQLGILDGTTDLLDDTDISEVDIG